MLGGGPVQSNTGTPRLGTPLQTGSLGGGGPCVHPRETPFRTGRHDTVARRTCSPRPRLRDAPDPEHLSRPARCRGSAPGPPRPPLEPLAFHATGGGRNPGGGGGDRGSPLAGVARRSVAGPGLASRQPCDGLGP